MAQRPADSGLKKKSEALKRALFMQDHNRAADIYRDLLKADPQFLLRDQVQYDLARDLEKHNHYSLAYEAYRLLLEFQPKNPARNPSLRSAGELAFKLRKYDEAAEYMSDYLDTEPNQAEREELREMVIELPPSLRARLEDRLAPPSTSGDALNLGDFKTPTPAEDRRASRSDAIVVEFSVKTPAPRKSADSHPKLTNPAAGRPSRSENPSHDEPAELPPAMTPKPAKRPEQEESAISLGGPASQPGTGDMAPPPMDPSRFSPPSGVWQPPPPAPFPAAPPAYPPPTPYGHPTPPSGVWPLPPQGWQPPYPSAPAPHPHYPSGAYPMPGYPPPQPPAPVPGTPAQAVPWQQTPPPADATPERRETIEERYERLREGRFAVLLPVGKKIHLDVVATLVGEVEGRTESDAKKRVLRRKGLVFDQLTLEQMLDLVPAVQKSQQALTFVHVPEALRIVHAREILSASLHDPGIKMKSAEESFKVRWKEIRLITCGAMNGESMVTVVGGEPLREFHFIDEEFDLEDLLPSGAANFDTGLGEFLGLLRERAPQAAISQTASAILKGRAGHPQPFAHREEYRNYSHWLLFTEFAEEVNAVELLEASQVASNW